MVMRKRLALPARLSYTALLAVAACSGETSSGPSDAASADAPVAEGGVDAPPVGADGAPADGGCDAQMYCGSNGTVDGQVCPGLVCDLSACPTGCEPFV
jgi:hypothetical protein